MQVHSSPLQSINADGMRSYTNTPPKPTSRVYSTHKAIGATAHKSLQIRCITHPHLRRLCNARQCIDPYLRPLPQPHHPLQSNLAASDPTAGGEAADRIAGDAPLLLATLVEDEDGEADVVEEEEEEAGGAG